uniref:Uncharacterized protein n=1 Tax=Anguilla anguilla TaxID=7936 RepID=A0A0E9UZQ7_ANGAN
MENTFMTTQRCKCAPGGVQLEIHI